MLQKTIFRILVIILGMCVFTSCARMNSNNSSSNITVDSRFQGEDHRSEPNNPIGNKNIENKDAESCKKEFFSMIDNKSNPIDIKYYLKNNVSSLTSIELTELFEKLLLCMETEAEEKDGLIFSDKYGDLTWKYSELIDDPDQLDKIENIEYRNIIKNIYERGFIIPLYEGYYPQVDVAYSTLYADFEELLTEEYTTYFDLAYFDYIYGAEGILVATVDELSESIHQHDMFIANYPDSKYVSEIEGYFKFRLSTYLQPLSEFGAVEENDIYTFGNDQIENYKKVISEYKNTEFAKIVDNYLKILVQNSYRDSKESEDFRKKYGVY